MTVCIDLNKDRETCPFLFNAKIVSEGTAASKPSPAEKKESDMNTILRQHDLPTGVRLSLVQGDITQADVEAIVNPANQHLMHGGGLAGLLSRKAGPAFQQESAAWVKEHGSVSHQSPAYTTAGDLPFRCIIHAVGPVWGSGSERAKLAAAVAGSLALADRLGLASLALPAISTGIFGYPLEEAAQVILQGVLDHCGLEVPSSLKSVQIVLFDRSAGEVFAAAWDGILT